MRIAPLDLSAVPTSRVQPLTQAWTVGQLVDLVVIGRRDENSIAIRVGGEVLRAETQASLPPGAHVLARVVATGPQPVLEPLTAPAATTSVQQVVRDTTTAVLPRQLAPGPALAMLAQHVAQVSQTPLPASAIGDAVQAIRSLLTSLPAAASLGRVAELARAVEAAGHGLEAALRGVVEGSRAALPEGDLKWRSLSVLSALRQVSATQELPGGSGLARSLQAPALPLVSPPAPGVQIAPTPLLPGNEPGPPPSAHPLAQALHECADLLEGLAARVTLRQLQHTEAAHGGAVYWAFDLPVAVDGRPDAIEFEFRHAGATVTGDEPPLSALVRVPLAASGELRARLSITGARLSVTLWSDDSTVRTQVSSELERLRAQLLSAGLTVERLGVAVVSDFDAHAYLPESLVDIQV
jgi:hypothetical protein